MNIESEPTGLVLRLAGVLQSWGGTSQYSWRETQTEPTKSGIIGLLAAADGRGRAADLTDLVALRMGVRTDQPGRLLKDFHTVADYRGRPLPNAKTDKAGKQKPREGKERLAPLLTHRFYLQDAVFTIALTGSGPLIEHLAAAVRQPAFPLALGRRSCPPSQPVYHSIHTSPATDPAAILAEVPWQATGHTRRHTTGPTVALPITVDDPTGTEILDDVPVTFDLTTPGKRASRRIRRGWVTVPTGHEPEPGQPTPNDHDPFALLGW